MTTRPSPTASEHALPLSLAEAPQALHLEVAHLLREGIPPKDLPPELRDQIYDITQLGPYVRYRWREDKHLSTISLGFLDDDPPRPFSPAGFSAQDTDTQSSLAGVT
jgi:hypothetical protein